MKTYFHGVKWTNHYKDPPSGMPRILLDVKSVSCEPDSLVDKKRFAILDRLRKKNIWGYNLTFDWTDNSVKRKWSDEAKKRNRLRRLEKRLAKKYSIPYLFEQARQNTINKNPGYYQ